MKLLINRYQADLLGVLSCYDRMIITGTLPGACYAGGMTRFLNSCHIKIFDYAKAFADHWRKSIRQRAHDLTDQYGITIEHMNKPHIRKEDDCQGHRTAQQTARGCCLFFPPRRRVPRTNPGMIKTPIRPFSAQLPANAYTITSTSSTRKSACVTCAYRPVVSLPFAVLLQWPLVA